jgi:hypothetical protein
MFSSNKVNDDDLASLLRHSPTDIASRLIGMLETENQSHYLRRSYLPRPPSSGAGQYYLMKHGQTKSSNHGIAINANKDNSRVVTTDVTTETRSTVVGWLYECVEYLNIPRDCVEVAMGYVDRVVPPSNSNLNLNLLSTLTENDSAAYLNDVLSSAISDATSYQLVALTSLYIAAKLERQSTKSKQQSTKMQSTKIHSLKRSVEVRDFVTVSHDIYTMKEIIDTERSILAKLDWYLNCPTSLTIAQHAIVLYCTNNTADAKVTSTSSSSSHAAAATSSLVHSVTSMIERSVLNYDVATSAMPSTIAYASILATLDPECRYGSLHESSFGRTLIMYGIVNEFDITTSRMVDGVRAMLLIDTLKNNSRYLHERLLVSSSSNEGRRIDSTTTATTIRQVYNKVVEEHNNNDQNIRRPLSLEHRSLSTSDSPIDVSDLLLSYDLDCNSRFTDVKMGKKMNDKGVATEKRKKFRRITVSSSNPRYSSSNNIDKIPSTIVMRAPVDTQSTISSLSSISTMKARSSSTRRRHSIDP